ncbi:MAG: DUF5946 family protein [Cyclobacteriaceae bacterium]|jgi:hypothetical protein
MQDYIDMAEKNGVKLNDTGKCQFCGADTERGVHECVEIFSLGFQLIDYSQMNNHTYRFLAVDAHTLQHPEIHGRWNNHFHLTRQHLMLHYKVKWNYQLSPRLSDHLNKYKAVQVDEYLSPPEVLNRGEITTTDILNVSDEATCKEMIERWAREVYKAWSSHHQTVDFIASGFMQSN